MKPKASLSLLIALVTAAVSPALPATQQLEAVPASPRYSVAVLPFAPRGVETSAWPRIKPSVYAELVRAGLDPVDEDRVELFLEDKRLRDVSLMTQAEVGALSAYTGAERVLLGDILRFDDTATPAVSLSARLLDPATDRVDAMTMVFVEGRDLAHPLGSGPAPDLDRTIQEAARRLAAGLGQAPVATGVVEVARPSHGRTLAPEPASYLSDRLASNKIERVAVLPFRYEGWRGGAGQAAADTAAWALISAGGISVVESGGAVRRLLERGWRMGQPVGRDEIAALGESLHLDAVLMGSVEHWEEGDPAGARPPAILLSARLIDAATGDLLWTAVHERRGDQTRVVYEIGNVRLTEELAARSAAEMLEPVIEAIRGGGR